MNIASLINDNLSKGQTAQEPRNGIGASAIGHDCDAYLSYELRGFPSKPLDNAILRIFNLGHAIETLTESAILTALPPGYSVSFEREGGGQHTFPVHGGHSWSTLDGIITAPDGSRIVVEIKSMNAARFEEFKLDGLEISNPKYFKQVQKQMHDSGLVECLVVAYCKNNSDIFCELIRYDMVVAAALDARIELAMRNGTRRKGDNRNAMSCRFCNRRDMCWGALTLLPVTPHCRNCNHGSASDNGEWVCSIHDPAIDPATCSDWVVYQPMDKV